MKENNIQETWKDIPGYEGLYQASNLGRIRSFKRNNIRILKPGKNRDGSGYYIVKLYLNSVRKNVSVHRLLWTAFNGLIPEGLQINHLNENKADNRLENLSLCTPKENTNYGTCIARRAKKFSKPVIQLDKNGNFIKEWSSSHEIQRQLGYLASNIRSCCCNLKPYAYDKNLDLNEIPEQTDISVNIQTKNSPEAAKRPLKKEKTDSIILF